MIRLSIILLFVCIAQCLGKSLESAYENVERLKRSPHYECDYGPRWPPPPPPPYWRRPPPPPPPFWPPPPRPPPMWGIHRQADFEQPEPIQQISDGGQSANLEASPPPLPPPVAAPAPCDTCTKSSSAISNAQSVNGDAVAVAVARSKGKR